MKPNLPNRETAVVRSEQSTQPLRFSCFPFHQPAEDDRIHAYLADQFGDSPLQGNLLFVERDGVWIESGRAPSPADPSWHPDLGHYVGTEVDIARHVLRAVPRGMRITISPTYDGNGKIGTSAIFGQHEIANPSRYERMAGDEELDLIPMARRVERMAGEVAEYLNIETWDDDSGLKDEFTLTISDKHLHLIHSDFEDLVLILTSEVIGSEWHHSSTLLLPVSNDPISIMRSLQPGAGRIHPLIEQAGSDENKFLKLLSNDAVIEAFEQVEHDNGLITRQMFSVRFTPGTLFEN